MIRPVGTVGSYPLDEQDLLAEDTTDSQGTSWEDLQRLVDALERGTGLRFGTSPAHPPGATETQLANLVKRLDAEGYDALWNWRRQWRLNEAFSRDEFGAVWNEGTRAIEYDAVQPRVHAPIFGATCDVLEARLNSTKPDLVIVPRSTDQASLDRARAANRAAKALYQDLDVDNARADVAHKLVRKGSVFGKLVFNERGGKYLGETTIPLRDENDQLVPRLEMDLDPQSPTFGEQVPVFGDDGVPEWEVERDELGEPKKFPAWEGALELSVVDPENVVTNACKRWKDRLWAIHRYYDDPIKAEQRWGFTGLRPDGKEQAEAPVMGSSQRPGRTSQRSDTKSVLVRECYIDKGVFPCSDEPGDTINFPQGWIIVECQGQVKAMPNRYGKGPLWYAKAAPGDEQMYGECIANRIRGMQATITRGLSLWDFVNDRNGSPTYVIPAAAGIVDAEKVKDPGAVVISQARNADGHPFVLEGSSVSSGVKEFVSLCFNDILGYISGVREGGLAGGTPANIEAAAAFQILVESDATRLATTTLGYGLWLRDLLEQIVWCVKTFMGEERIYALVGADGEPEAEELAGSSIANDDFAFVVAPESIKPQSDAVRRANILSDLNMGVVSLSDAKEALGRLNEGNDARLMQRLISQCKREAKSALRDHAIMTPAQKMKWEDHALAIDMHRADLFDQRYEDDADAAAVLLVHMDIHEWLHVRGWEQEIPFPGDPSLLAGFTPPMQPLMAAPGPGQPSMPGNPTQQGNPAELVTGAMPALAGAAA